MMRLSLFVSAAFVFCNAASAAPLSAFSVEAEARMQLVGATYAGTGGDALGDLSISYVLDQFDDFPNESGNADLSTEFIKDEATGYVKASATGSADAPFGSAMARVHGRLLATIENTSGSAINLVFDYAASLTTLASGQSADAAANAFVELQDFFGQVFVKEVTNFDPVTNFSGTTSLTIGTGETVYAASYAEVFGDAFAFQPAPIPLPAALPLLAAALGGLALCRRRT